MHDWKIDPIEAICANSYRNFHVKGLDYLCLQRTPEFTRKVYFFDGDLVNVPEIVMPHDHRYPFNTTVLAGGMCNHTYRALDAANLKRPGVSQRFDHFSYNTPLNGGDGFTWRREVFLKRGLSQYCAGYGAKYVSAATDIHTLEICEERTVIMIEQYADVVAAGVPTNAYRLAGSRQPPNLSGLYDHMDADHAIKLIKKLFWLAPGET